MCGAIKMNKRMLKIKYTIFMQLNIYIILQKIKRDITNLHQGKLRTSRHNDENGDAMERGLADPPGGSHFSPQTNHSATASTFFSWRPRGETLRDQTDETLERAMLCLLAFAATLASASAAPGPTDFSLYLANDSLIGQHVPCTEAEKECLRYNRLLYKRHCYPMGHGPKDCMLFVDKQEFQYESGHLRGKCIKKNQCAGSGGEFRMAYDGRCVRYKDVVKICNGAQNLEFAPHFFGDTECVRVEFSLPRPTHVPQPEQSGKCAFPNLRHDMTSVRAMEARRLGLRCDEPQSACFAKEQVWFEPARRCVRLLRRGPCAEGERVVLQLSERRGSKSIAAVCAPVNSCRPDQRRLAFDGQCYDVSKIRTVLCPTGVLLPNAYGQYSCSGVKDIYKHVILLESHRPGSCEIVHKVSHLLSGPGVRVVPDCSLSDPGECSQAVNDLLVSVAKQSPNEVPVPY